MANIIIEDVPESILKSFGNRISYTDIDYSFFLKKRQSFFKDFISPDLKFTPYNEMNLIHKEKFDEISKIEKTSLLNI